MEGNVRCSMRCMRWSSVPGVIPSLRMICPRLRPAPIMATRSRSAGVSVTGPPAPAVPAAVDAAGEGRTLAPVATDLIVSRKSRTDAPPGTKPEIPASIRGGTGGGRRTPAFRPGSFFPRTRRAVFTRVLILCITQVHRRIRRKPGLMCKEGTTGWAERKSVKEMKKGVDLWRGGRPYDSSSSASSR